MQKRGRRLRVALVAGTLGRGGAEKQLCYMARALHNAQVDVQVYCLTNGEYFESSLRQIGLQPFWFGRRRNPLARLWSLSQELKRFRPDIIQSAHTYVNSYVSLTGRRLRTISLGALRSSVSHSRAGNGLWTEWLIRSPDGLVVNSMSTADELLDQGLLSREQTFVVPNVIDPGDPTSVDHYAEETTEVYFIGRLIPVKRLDRFIRAVALASRGCSSLRAVVVGDGQDRVPMQQLARQQLPATGRITFLGERGDISDLLQHAAMLVVSSDDEGSPNVVLEAMAAGVPVISTPVGDVPQLLRNGDTGFVVPFDDVERMADRIRDLAASQMLQSQIGEAAQEWVRTHRSPVQLGNQLLEVYRDLARQRGQASVERLASQPVHHRQIANGPVDSKGFHRS